MKFGDIWDDRLHVIQEKTGSEIALPLSFGFNAINWCLRNVTAQCRDYAVSPIMFICSVQRHRLNGAVKSNTITANFSKARDKTGIDWEDGTPAIFHEQRS